MLDLQHSFYTELEWCAHNPGKENESAQRITYAVPVQFTSAKHLPQSVSNLITVSISIFLLLLLILPQAYLACCPSTTFALLHSLVANNFPAGIYQI